MCKYLNRLSIKLLAGFTTIILFVIICFVSQSSNKKMASELISCLSCLEGDYVQLTEESTYSMGTIENGAENILNLSTSKLIQDFYANGFAALIEDGSNTIIVLSSENHPYMFLNGRLLSGIENIAADLSIEDYLDSLSQIILDKETHITKTHDGIYELSNNSNKFIGDNPGRFELVSRFTIQNGCLSSVDQNINIETNDSFSRSHITQSFSYISTQTFAELTAFYTTQYNLSDENPMPYNSLEEFSTVYISGYPVSLLEEFEDDFPAEEFKVSNSILNVFERELNNNNIIVEERTVVTPGCEFVVDVVRIENQFIIVGIQSSQFQYLSVFNGDTKDKVKEKLQYYDISEINDSILIYYENNGIKYEIKFDFQDNQASHLTLKAI